MTNRPQGNTPPPWKLMKLCIWGYLGRGFRFWPAWASKVNGCLVIAILKFFFFQNSIFWMPYISRVVGNLRRPPKTCHSSSESWENGDSEYVIRYAGKIRPFLKFQYLHNIRNYLFWPDLRRLPSQQTPNIWYVLVANMLESNPVVRNISEIHLRLHKLRCIPMLTLHIQHGSHSHPPAASL